jgi:hypothetical protein
VAATIENFVSPCRGDSVPSAENPLYRQVLPLVGLQPLVAVESWSAFKGATAINLFIRTLRRRCD